MYADRSPADFKIKLSTVTNDKLNLIECGIIAELATTTQLVNDYTRLIQPSEESTTPVIIQHLNALLQLVHDEQDFRRKVEALHQEHTAASAL